MYELLNPTPFNYRYCVEQLSMYTLSLSQCKIVSGMVVKGYTCTSTHCYIAPTIVSVLLHVFNNDLICLLWFCSAISPSIYFYTTSVSLDTRHLLVAGCNKSVHIIIYRRTITQGLQELQSICQLSAFPYISVPLIFALPEKRIVNFVPDTLQPCFS